MSHHIKSIRVTTRKAHKCWGCMRIIPSGTRMMVTTGVDMNQIHSAYWCATCEAVMDEWHYEDRADVSEGMVKDGDEDIWEEIRVETEETP